MPKTKTKKVERARPTANRLFLLTLVDSIARDWMKGDESCLEHFQHSNGPECAYMAIAVLNKLLTAGGGWGGKAQSFYNAISDLAS